MEDKDLVPVGNQMLLPGVPEKERRDQYIPTTSVRGLKPTKRERLFARYFARTGKASESARRAGFSIKNAASYANELLHKTQVLELIRQEEMEYLAEINFTKIGVVTKLAQMHNADLALIYNEDGTIKPLIEWRPQERTLLAGIENEELFSGKGKEREYVGRIKKVRTADPIRLMELALKYHQALSERVVFPDAQGNPQPVGGTKIEVVFVNAPGLGPHYLEPGTVIDGEISKK